MTRRQINAQGRILLLAGGGHSHVAVLADWIRRAPPRGSRTVLLTPHPQLRYSGMVPGWLAGQHDKDDGLVDLAALAARAGVELVLDRLVGIDPEARVVHTAGGQSIAFDIASLDTGGEGRAAAVLGDDARLIDVRPIDAFVERIAARPVPARVVVAGGGAGGVELAFGLRNLSWAEARPEVALVTGGEGLLPGFAFAVHSRVASALSRQGIAVITGDARFEGGVLSAAPSQDPFASSEVEKPVSTTGFALRSTRTQVGGGSFSLEPADLIIAALGSAAPEWARASGLAVDAEGFISVDPQQRSLSHPQILAVGDVASRTDGLVTRSGVHAVRAGPVLAANLRAALAGEAPRAAFRPRRHSLYLINTGDGRAIASFGRWTAMGRWVLALKHRIDKAWIAKYAARAKVE